MTREQFLTDLREALNRLHDPDRLIHSPLAVHFGVAHRYDTYSALQAILTDAIGALEPATTVPPDSRAWRIYDLLSCRYVQELTVPEVATQLGVGVRHLRREQRAALEAPAYALWEQYGLQETDEARQGAPMNGAVAANVPVVHELAWVRDTQLDGPTDLRAMLESAIGLVRPLADRHAVEVESYVEQTLPPIAVHPVALDQMLLSVLTVAIHRTSGGRVHVRATPLSWEAEVTVACGIRLASGPPPSDDDAASLQLARRLAQLCGCRLALPAGGEPFETRLTLPAYEQLPVLVIDDNEDTLRLLGRYAIGSRYRLVGTSEPGRALEIAASLSPQIVVLDVMMPQIDGWRLLGQLREHPLTHQVPAVVCTILAQEDLARSLGAADFVRKPATQRDLLAALDRQAANLAPVSG